MNLITRLYVCFLKCLTVVSLQSLKRRLDNYGLNKIGSVIQMSVLYVRIEREANGPSSMKKYQNMWNSLCATHFLSKDKVM